MSMRRILAAAATTMLVSSGALFVGASPASAASANPATFVSADPSCHNWTVIGGVSAPPATKTATVTGQVGDTFTVTFDSPAACSSYVYSTQTGSPASPASGTLSDGVAQTFTITGSGTMRFGTSLPALTLTVVAPDPAVPAAEAPPVPATWSLGLNADGGVCETSATSGAEGTWQQLPKATECSKAGSTLLGWATSAAFPVGRAKEQVAKGWGAIDEVIGGVRMIFIPAGGYTFITGENSLYAIWG